ncbi:hypothetical protein [Clostridium septicum]|uniref:hypothetical protein n=1 Tax=Clostridium septicum TaxID=1504 RepID=UPI001FAB2100|nr:hypothetical protein [Clostridium septicum]
MKLKDIVNGVLYSGSNFIRTQGKTLFDLKLVSNIKSKKIDNIYHIYGKVLNENNSKDYSCHIKIDLNSNKIIGSNCSCEDFSNNSKYNINFICKHIIATTYKFYDLAKEKIPNLKQDSELNGNRILKLWKNKKNIEILDLNIKIKSINTEKYNYYEAEFRIGNKYNNLINSLKVSENRT